MLKNKPFWITLVLLAVYLSAGYFAGPHLLQPRLEEFVASELGRDLHFRQLQFDPITLSIELEQVELLDTGQSPWPDISMQADAVQVRFNFWRLRPAIADLLITAPVLEIAAGAAQPYPFGSLWQQWRNIRPGASAGKTISLARWRVKAGRVSQAGITANAANRVLLDQVNLQASKAGSTGLGHFSLDFRTALATEFQAQGSFDPADGSAYGDYQLAARTVTSTPDDGLKAAGKIQAELLDDRVQFQLNDSHLQATDALLCWRKQVLCARFFPLSAAFVASGLATTKELEWQGMKAEMQAFGLQLSLGQGKVELLEPLAFAASSLELHRQQSTVPLDLQQAEPAGFDIRLDATGEWQAKSVGRFDPSVGTAELGFEVSGADDFNGLLRLQDFPPQPSQAAFAQLELQLQNPAATWARDFADQHLSGQLLAENLGLQILANQDDLGLELVGQVSLNGPSLQAGQAGRVPAGLDPQWLLAMWQNPVGDVELEILQQAVEMTPKGKLRHLLESQVLDLLLESSEQPFKSLARLVGSDNELPLEITFPAGSAATGAANDQAIQALGTALAMRPGLSVAIPAVYDPLIDNKALQTEQVRTHIALAGAAELSFQSGAEPTDFTDPVVHSVIDEFARQRLPADVLAAFVEHFGQADVDQGIIPEGDVTAYYAALFELLVDYAEIPRTALTSLARYRAQAVVDGLTRQGVDLQRLQVSTEAQTSAATLEGVPLPLALGIRPGPGIENPTPEPGVEPWE
jgi:hypothetical protein